MVIPVVRSKARLKRSNSSEILRLVMMKSNLYSDCPVKADWFREDQ